MSSFAKLSTLYSKDESFSTPYLPYYTHSTVSNNCFSFALLLLAFPDLLLIPKLYLVTFR